MKKEQIENAIQLAWNQYRDDEETVTRPSENFEHGFVSGAEWFRNSVWHTPENAPEDGDYLTVLKRKRHGGYSERTFVEVAPWRNGEYHGSNHMGVAIGQIEVVMCANINDFLLNVSELDRLKVREKMTTEEIEIKEINYL